MTNIKATDIAFREFIQNPTGDPHEFLKLTEDPKKTRFDDTNEMVNEGVNGVLSAGARLGTPYVAAKGGYKKEGIKGLVKGGLLGFVGWWGALKNLGSGLLGLGLTPSAAAIDGAQYVKGQIDQKNAASQAAAEGFKAALTGGFVNAAADPIGDEPIEVFNPYVKEKVDEKGEVRDRTDFDEAGRDVRRAGNRLVTLVSRLFMPFFGAYSAGKASRSQGDNAALQGLAGSGGFVGGTVNAVGGAVVDTALAAFNILRSGGNVVEGMAKRVGPYVQRAWESVFGEPTQEMGTYMRFVKKPFGDSLQVLKLEESSEKTPFDDTNEWLNQVVNGTASFFARLPTPLVTMAGAYKEGGILGGAIGFVFGFAGWAGAVYELAKAGAGVVMSPISAAVDGAEALQDARPSEQPDEKTFGQKLIDLAAEPVFDDPVPFLNPHAKEDEEGYSSDWNEAARDSRRAVNRFLTLFTRITLPFIGLGTAAKAAVGREGGAIKVIPAAIAGLAGGAVTGSAGAIADVTLTLGNGLRAGGNVIQGAARAAGSYISAAWSSVFGH